MQPCPGGRLDCHGAERVGKRTNCPHEQNIVRVLAAVWPGTRLKKTTLEISVLVHVPLLRPIRRAMGDTIACTALCRGCVKPSSCPGLGADRFAHRVRFTCHGHGADQRMSSGALAEKHSVVEIMGEAQQPNHFGLRRKLVLRAAQMEFPLARLTTTRRLYIKRQGRT